MTSDYDLALSFLQLKTTLGQLGPGEWRGTASDLLALLTQLGLPDPPRPNTFTCWLRT
jgi:hypothetical protein